MKGFNLTPSYSSLRAASEFSSFKRSAKGFSLKKPSLNFHKGTYLMLRRSHDGFTSTPTPPAPSAPVRASAHIPESLYDDDVICISREDAFDSSSADDISPDELQTPSTTPYASSYSSSSSSLCHLPPEIDDHSSSPVGEAMGEYDPRRGSQLSVISSWVGHHLQELGLSYDEDDVCEIEIEIFTTPGGFPSRKDSLILPPGETFESYRRKRNPPVVLAKQPSRVIRPLPRIPRTGPGFDSQSRPIRPLPLPPPR